MPGGRRSRASCIGIAITSAVVGCSTTQEVPLPCVTDEMYVYVDGRLLEGTPEAIRLDRREPHKIYVKRHGRRPQLVVLVPEEGEDGLHLVPDDVCVQLVPVGLDRELSVDAEEPPADAAP